MAPTNHYHNTRFLTSAQDIRQMPEDSGIEVAIAGRSNAGKSSVLNTLTRQKRLARVSKTPGRTRLLNCFEVGPGRRIIDLPGYGYARVGRETQRSWGRVLDEYFRSRSSLRGLILIVDIRHGLKEHDRQMQDWCGANGLSLHIVLNKADKLSRGAASSQVLKLFPGEVENLSVQQFSALKGSGIEELSGVLDAWFEW